MDDLKGKVAIVTGSSTGVGSATAMKLAAKGCNVVINYTKSEKEAKETRAAVEDLGVETILCQADVSNDDDCKRMTSEAVDKWGRVDALVNNAGTTKFCSHKDLDGLSKEDFLHIYSVNVVGPYQMIKAVVPHMKKTGRGSIVNVASVAGITGTGSSIAYATSKGALVTMTLSMARVLGPEIRVNAICPGIIRTPLVEGGARKTNPDNPEAVLDSTAAVIPMGRLGDIDEIGELAAFLASEESKYITGTQVVIDGGLTLPETAW